MISNNSLDQKTILAQILSYMDHKYSIYSIPHFGGFRRNLLYIIQVMQINASGENNEGFFSEFKSGSIISPKKVIKCDKDGADHPDGGGAEDIYGFQR